MSQFTETTSQSWFGKIGSSFAGAGIGILMTLVAFPVLFFNEGRSVKTYKSLQEGSGAVVSAPATKVEQANEGKLVHLSGKAEPGDAVSDPQFGVTGPVVKLQRSVVMYQWKETKKSESKDKLGGGKETVTTYDYNKAWSDELIKSSSFKYPANHENPEEMPFESQTFEAETVTLGVFTLSKGLVDQMRDFEPLPLDPEKPLPRAVSVLRGKLVDGSYYLGPNPQSPQVGDTKITFTQVPAAIVSVIARQTDDSLAPYQTKAGDALEMLSMGDLDAKAMFKQAQDSNVVLTWILRGVGFFLMFIGLCLAMKPLSALASVLPFLGGLVGGLAGVVAFLIAAIGSCLTIAVAWIFYRPLLGISLLVISAGLIVLLALLSRKRAGA